MNFKRFGMALVALVLVVCLLVNVSPIKAKAIEPVSTTLAVGVAACMILASAGVVFHPKTQEHIEAAGKAFSTYLYQWGTSAEQIDAIDGFLGGLSIYEGDPDDDDDWQPRFDIPDLLRRGVALFTAACIGASGLVPKDYSVDAPTVAEGDLNEYWSIEKVNAALAEAASHKFAFFCTDGLSVSHSPRPVVAYSDSSPILFRNDGDSFYSIVTEDGSSFSVYHSQWDSLTWTSETIASVYIPENEVWFGTENTIGAPYYIGDIPEKVQNGEYDEETLPLPETIYYGNLIDPDLGAAQSIIELADDLVNGEISFDQYISYITVPEADPVPDPSEEPEPSETQTPDLIIPEPGIDTDSLANADPNTFLERLGTYITTPFRWIWSNIETLFEPLTHPELWINPLVQTVTQAAQNAADQVSEAVKNTFVPDKDYLTDKVNALLAEYAFAESIVNTAKSIKTGLAGITTEPPVIYIHLEDTRGSYNIGGTIPFLDLRWYAEYKPTVDTIISAFLWICFAWKMLLKLPGIISGMPGDFVMDSVHYIGMSEAMPVRSKDYEIQRVNSRQMFRRGKDG